MGEAAKFACAFRPEKYARFDHWFRHRPLGLRVIAGGQCVGREGECAARDGRGDGAALGNGRFVAKRRLYACRPDVAWRAEPVARVALTRRFVFGRCGRLSSAGRSQAALAPGGDPPRATSQAGVVSRRPLGPRRGQTGIVRDRPGARGLVPTRLAQSGQAVAVVGHRGHDRRHRLQGAAARAHLPDADLGERTHVSAGLQSVVLVRDADAAAAVAAHQHHERQVQRVRTRGVQRVRFVHRHAEQRLGRLGHGLLGLRQAALDGHVAAALFVAQQLRHAAALAAVAAERLQPKRWSALAAEVHVADGLRVSVRAARRRYRRRALAHAQPAVGVAPLAHHGGESEFRRRRRRPAAAGAERARRLRVAAPLVAVAAGRRGQHRGGAVGAPSQGLRRGHKLVRVLLVVGVGRRGRRRRNRGDQHQGAGATYQRRTQKVQHPSSHFRTTRSMPIARNSFRFVAQPQTVVET